MSEPTSPKVNEYPPRDESTGFDLRVEITDAQTGKIIKHQPYNFIVDRERGKYFERGGKYYTLNGQETTGPVKPTPVVAAAVVTPVVSPQAK